MLCLNTVFPLIEALTLYYNNTVRPRLLTEFTEAINAETLMARIDTGFRHMWYITLFNH